MSDEVSRPEVVPGNGQPFDPTEGGNPGVVVLRIPGEQPGQEDIRIIDINGIDPLSVPTLLRIASNLRNQALGL